MIEATFGARAVQAKGSQVHFKSPIKILKTNRLEEIYSLLEAAEAAAKSGYWVALMLSYEAAPAFDPALKTRAPGPLPLAWVAVFEEAVEVCEQSAVAEYHVGPWAPLVTRAAFDAAIVRIHEFIASGDTYQVNYTFPVAAKFKGDSRSWYKDLRLAQGAGYCANFDLGRYKVLSLSPELFFEREGLAIRTRPMKGTVKRGRWLGEDQRMAKKLAKSAKDRAENVMIVDLLRNDLGRVSVPGSVSVPTLFEIERYETLWQMTSKVEATLRNDVGLPELLAALFPCGSITGAPKIRTMEIIRELESFPRGVYTGTIGFLRPGGDCVFSVAIRTVVIDSETCTAIFGVGGGITYDSTAEREYDECLLKSSFLSASTRPFQLLESLLLENGEFYLMARHIERIGSSAEYFGFCYMEKNVVCQLEGVALKRSRGRWKIRLLLSPDGEIETEAVELDSADVEPLRVALSAEPVDSNDKFLFHKTTNRKVYNNALAKRVDCDDVVLWNERGEITESTIANVVLLIDGELFTPPQNSGLLAGTFREELLAQGKIRERVIYKEELRRFQSFFLINSVHKWMKANLVD